MDKKAEVRYLGELILICAIIILAIMLFYFFGKEIFSELGARACNSNVAMRGEGANTISKYTGGLLNVPVLFCGQYQRIEKINAGADFASCQEINKEICNSNTKEPLKTECEKQCARIQIDKLTDKCWQAGGMGRFNLRAGIPEKLYNLPVLLRCAQFQVSNPSKLSFSDDSSGNSTNYCYDADKGSIVWCNSITGSMPLRGQGVLGVTNATGKMTHLIPEDKKASLDYSYSPKATCTISFLQDADSSSVTRHCNGWIEGGMSVVYLN